MSAYRWNEWDAGYREAEALSEESREALMASRGDSWSDSRWAGFRTRHREVTTKAAMLLKVRDSLLASIRTLRALGADASEAEASLALLEPELDAACELVAEPAEDAN